MSIRSRLSADQRAEAEHVYALLRANKAHAIVSTLASSVAVRCPTALPFSLAR